MKILFIVYQFPPSSGPAVHRNFAFANGLAMLGHEVHVFTKDIKNGKNASLDHSYSNAADDKLIVHPVPTHERRNLIRVLTKWRLFRPVWFLLYPLFWERVVGWFFQERKRLLDLYDSSHFDCVYTSSGPFTTMLFGKYLQKRREVTWIADLRDPFTDAYMWAFPSKLHWILSRSFERWLFSNPDKLIVTSWEYKKLLISRRIQREDKIEVITNGFDG